MLESTASTGVSSTMPSQQVTTDVTPIADVADRRHGRAEPNGDPALLDPRGERLPHLARPEPRVVELLDERRDVVALDPEQALQRMREREVLDPLRGPLGSKLRAGDPPHLLGVRPEEGVVEPSPEPGDDPVLERELGPGGAEPAPEVRHRAAERLDEPETADHVARLQRVREERAVEVDARKARAHDELVAEHVLPQPLDRLDLRVEAMSAEIEAVPLPRDGACDSADSVAGLEDDGRRPARGEDVRGGQAGRTCSDHRDQPAVRRDAAFVAPAIVCIVPHEPSSLVVCLAARVGTHVSHGCQYDRLVRASSASSRLRRSAAILVALTESDLRSRYGRGRSVMFKWLFDPFFALGVYFILVAVMLNRGGHDRALVIACSVVPFQLVMTSFTSSLQAVRLRRSILTNMRFERNLLPLSTVLTETVAFSAALTLLALTMALSRVAPTPYALWLLVLIPETIVLALAFAYPATLFGLLYPDLRSFGVSAIRTLYFLAPSLVALGAVHGVAADLLKLNPLSGLFEGYRSALLYGETPPLWTFRFLSGTARCPLRSSSPLYRAESMHFAKVVE